MTNPAYCPYCNKWHSVYFDTDKATTPALVYCDPENNGCNHYFVVALEILTTVNVYKLLKP